MKIALLQFDASPLARETELANRLGIPLLPSTSMLSAGGESAQTIDFYLRYELPGLSLYSTHADAPGAVRVDFSDARLNFRVGNSAKNQSIVKAIGIKGSNRPLVLDATAGLGKDAYLLASLGCEVQMLERSPIVHALLQDGLQRAVAAQELPSEAARRMQLHNEEFLKFAAKGVKFDVVYLDPMFPARNKSARVKKDMYLLQELLGHDESSDRLLPEALAMASKRVVVKRGKLSPFLGLDKPDIEFKGSSSRYDVYLTR